MSKHKEKPFYFVSRQLAEIQRHKQSEHSLRSQMEMSMHSKSEAERQIDSMGAHMRQMEHQLMQKQVEMSVLSDQKQSLELRGAALVA